MQLPTLLSIAGVVAAAPFAAATSDFPAVNSNAWNFVVNALGSENHLKPINVDSETGFLTLNNDTHLTLKFDDAGHAIDPTTSKQLNFTNIIMQTQLIDGEGFAGLAVKDGVLTKDGTSSFGMCPNGQDGFNIYWVSGELPCHNMISLSLSAVPIYMWNI